MGYKVGFDLLGLIAAKPIGWDIGQQGYPYLFSILIPKDPHIVQSSPYTPDSSWQSRFY